MVRHRRGRIRHRQPLQRLIQHQPLLGWKPNHIPRWPQQRQRPQLHRRRSRTLPPLRRRQRHITLQRLRRELQHRKRRKIPHRRRRDVLQQPTLLHNTPGTRIPLRRLNIIPKLQPQLHRPRPQRARRLPHRLEPRLIQHLRVPSQLLAKLQRLRISIRSPYAIGRRTPRRRDPKHQPLIVRRQLHRIRSSNNLQPQIPQPPRPLILRVCQLPLIQRA